MFDGRLQKKEGSRPTGWAILLLVLLSACTILDPDTSIPEHARVLLSGTSDDDLELIVSTRFSRASVGGAVVFSQSDTTFIDLAAAHDEVYDIAPDRGFFFRVSKPAGAEAVVSIKVWIDGDLEYERDSYSFTSGAIEFSRIYGQVGS